MKPKRILVTSALPYANGPIHLGHMVEHVQMDVWARFQRMQGHRVLTICADDTHGTPIMIKSRREGRPEVELIAEMNEAHQRDFASFDIRYDHYGSTHSEANRALCHRVWAALRKEAMVHEREVERLYDPKEGIFLADRFVKGTCPRCKTPDQYGDACDACGATYAAADMIDPVSTLSGTKPEHRISTQLFVEIERLHGFLDEWARGEHLQPEVSNYLTTNFLGEPLRDWDVSRPAPYFGFEIPDAPGQYWYVWFDAPLGYVASTAEWCRENGEDLSDWWQDGDNEIVHVIGKDIVYFHTLFWPSMLRTAGLSLPTRVQVHGFLTVHDAKMSKSKGTFVLARDLAERVDPSFLRYFYASKLGPGLDDIDLDAEEMAAKVNSDLVGKVVNLASRTARFAKGTGLSGAWPADGGLFEAAAEEGDRIARDYDGFDLARATRRIMALADRANQYVEQKEPWRLKKEAGKEREVQDVATVSLNLFRQIVLYLAPVLPDLAKKTQDLLGAPMERWEASRAPLLGTPVAKFEPMLQRMEASQIP